MANGTPSVSASMAGVQTVDVFAFVDETQPLPELCFSQQRRLAGFDNAVRGVQETARSTTGDWSPPTSGPRPTRARRPRYRHGANQLLGVAARHAASLPTSRTRSRRATARPFVGCTGFVARSWEVERCLEPLARNGPMVPVLTAKGS
jgi:hypothetical protein